MTKRSFDGCIGRALKLASRTHPDERYTMNEAVSQLMALPDAKPFLDHYRWNGAALAIRSFLYSQTRAGKINGQSLEGVPTFLCGPGNRWGRTADFTRDELDAIIARRTKQQRGFDPEIKVLTTIRDLMPDSKMVIGEVLT